MIRAELRLYHETTTSPNEMIRRLTAILDAVDEVQSPDPAEPSRTAIDPDRPF